MRGPLLTGAGLLAASLATAQTAPVPRPETPLSQSAAPAPRPDSMDAAAPEDFPPETIADEAPAAPDAARPPTGARAPLQDEAARPAPRPARESGDAATEAPSNAADDGTELPAEADSEAPSTDPEDVAVGEDGETSPPPEVDTSLAETPQAAPASRAEDAPPLWRAHDENLLSFIGCIAALTATGAEFRLGETLTDTETHTDCGIRRPVTVTYVLPGIAFEGEATLRCEAALALALWTHEVAAPAAARLDGAPRLTAYLPGTSYACRPRAGTDRLSEHALGNAVDIAGFRLSDGQTVMIEPREGDRLAAFQRAVQAGACQFFTTVLGPGSDAAHDDHLHLDVIDRANGWRICQ